MSQTSHYDYGNATFLEANRRGELATAQRQQVGFLAGYGGCMLICLLVIGCAISAMALAGALVAIAIHATILTVVIALAIAAGAGTLIYIPARSLRRPRAIRQDLAAGRVASAFGEVTYHQGQYSIVAHPAKVGANALGVGSVSNRRLDTIQQNQNFVPSSYTVYYLPTSGCLVALEPVGATPDKALAASADATVGAPGGALAWAAGEGRIGAPSADPSAMAGGWSTDEPAFEEGFDLTAELARALGYPVEALESNRLGQIDRTQRRRLFGAAASNLAFGVPIAIMGAALIAYSIVSHPADSPALPWIVGLSFFGAGVFLVMKAGRVLADAREGRVVWIQGPTRRLMSKAGGSAGRMTYDYEITGDDGLGGHKRTMLFSVQKAAYDVIVGDRAYRVYYSPRGKLLVGIEPIEREFREATKHGEHAGGRTARLLA